MESKKGRQELMTYIWVDVVLGHESLTVDKGSSEVGVEQKHSKLKLGRWLQLR